MLFLINVIFAQVAVADEIEKIKMLDSTDLLDEAIADGEKEATAESVDINLLVVHASTSGTNIDPKLKNLTSHLENYKYTSYSLVKEYEKGLNDKKEEYFVIQGGRTITITLLSHDEKRARLKIRMLGAKGKLLLDTTASVKRNGTFIVAGPKYKEGILFLPITAKY